MNKKIGFIGAGKMATAIIQGILRGKLFEPQDIFVSDKSEVALNKIKTDFGVRTSSDNLEIVKNSDIVLFAVKPFVLLDVLKEIKQALKPNQILLSIVAGMSKATIKEVLGDVTIVRIMPNTPALVGAGMSAICPDDKMSDEQKEFVLNIFSSIGEVVIADEKDIDTITAISGSGPAFYYRFIEDMARAGEKLGLSYQTALKLSAQTALGSAKMVLKGDVAPEQLIVNVTTPGGCTAVGNDVLKENNITQTIFDTIEKTKIKAFELGKK